MIFRSSRSLMFFKIGVLKNFETSTRISSALALADFLLHNTYGSCFWIFAAANTFFQLNLVFIADSCTDIRSKLLWKYELSLISNHWNSSVKKGVIGNAANFTGKRQCWSLFLIELQDFRPAVILKRDSNTDVFLWNLKKI